MKVSECLIKVCFSRNKVNTRLSFLNKIYYLIISFHIIVDKLTCDSTCEFKLLPKKHAEGIISIVKSM